MSNLSAKQMKAFKDEYFGRFGLKLEEVSKAGKIVSETGYERVRNHQFMRRVRGQSMYEGLRWGDVSTFFVAPGVVSWILPVTFGKEINGGLLGGEVVPRGISLDRLAVSYSLMQTGCSQRLIDEYMASLVEFPQERIQEACDCLLGFLHEISHESERTLAHHREEANQQRDISERIQEKKGATSSEYSLNQERILLSLIRVGDKTGARGVLNDMLASCFLYSPKLSVIKARMIEMMGHLVRSAVEDSPVLESLLSRQQDWINWTIEAKEFGEICNVVRMSLDDFIDQVFLHSYNKVNINVHKALEYIAEHYTESISLDDVSDHVGLSRYRIAHLVKDVTAQSVLQHVKRMRVEKAQEMLVNTSESYIDITYKLGFTDQSAFIKQFRQLTGVTPAKYRKTAV